MLGIFYSIVQEYSWCFVIVWFIIAVLHPQQRLNKIMTQLRLMLQKAMTFIKEKQIVI